MLTPIIVPFLSSITEEETEIKEVKGLCKTPETVKLFLNNELSLTLKIPPALRVPIVPKLVREELIKCSVVLSRSLLKILE